MSEEKRPADQRSTLRPGDEAQPGTPGSGENVCPVCAGSGRVNDRTCPECDGTGGVVEGIGGG